MFQGPRHCKPIPTHCSQCMTDPSEAKCPKDLHADIMLVEQRPYWYNSLIVLFLTCAIAYYDFSLLSAMSFWLIALWKLTHLIELSVSAKPLLSFHCYNVLQLLNLAPWCTWIPYSPWLGCLSPPTVSLKLLLRDVILSVSCVSVSHS